MLGRSKRKKLMWLTLVLFIVNGGLGGYQYATYVPPEKDMMADPAPAMDDHSVDMLEEELTPAQKWAKAQEKKRAAAAKPEEPVKELTPAEKWAKAQAKKRSAEQENALPGAEHPEATAAQQMAESEMGAMTEAPSLPQPEPEPEPPQMVCYEAGVFPTKAAANKLDRQLKKRKIETKITRKIKTEKLGYWVYLKPERSLALSRLKAEEVKLKGIKDVAVVTRANPKWAISLGVFQFEKTAKARKAKAESLGLKPEMSPRYSSESQFRVQMTMVAGEEPDQNAWTEMLKGQKDIEIKPMECK